MRRLFAAQVVLTSLAAATSAEAYDSRCYKSFGSSEECKAGPDAVRNRFWNGNRAEHTHLFLQSLTLSGLPSAVEEELELEVYTNGSEFSLEGQMVPTARPSSFKDGMRATFPRTLRVAELAELPDFSYSLWDWASGNETCPLDPQLPAPVSAVDCHDFRGHMGASNSNHFVPQSQGFFAHYHGLALQRAAACRAMGEALGPERARFIGHVRECEKEALALESVAHHFLQDAWSSGHMWERWGSPDPSDYQSLHEAVMVGLTTGLIHGARGELLAAEGILFREANDNMCAPGPEVQWVSGAGVGPFPGLGDFYSSELYNDASFAPQRKALFDCAVSSLRAVYNAFGSNAAHGPANPPDANVVMSLDPTSADCFGQRVTNEALVAGAALNVTRHDGTAWRIPLAVFAGSLVPLGGFIFGYGLDPGVYYNPSASSVQYNLDMVEILAKMYAYEYFSPDGTDMAGSELPALLGMERNSAYASVTPLSGYVESGLPWRPDGDEKAATLARVFRRAHAKDWCETIKSDGGDFDPRFLVEAVAATTAGTSARDEACETCVAFMQPLTRVGFGEGDYDRTREPLCHYLAASTTAFRYAVPSRNDLERQLAATRVVCGCDPGQSGPVAVDGRVFAVHPDANSPYTRRVCGVGNNIVRGFRLADFATRLPVVDEPAELVPMMFGGEPVPSSLEYELVSPMTDGSGLIEVRATAVSLGPSHPVTLRFPGTLNQASILIEFGEVRGPAEIVEGDAYPGGLSPGAYIATFPLPRQLLDWNGVPYGEVALELEGRSIPPMTFQYEWVPSAEPPEDPYLYRFYDWIQGGYYVYRSDPFFEYPDPFMEDLSADFRLVYPAPGRQDLVEVEKLTNTWETFVELSTYDSGCGTEGARTTWHRLNP